MPFELAPLPYPADALEAAIDKTTMEIHHGRHHKAYVDNLNAALAGHDSLLALPVDQLMRQIDIFATFDDGHGVHHAHLPFLGDQPTQRLATGGAGLREPTVRRQRVREVRAVGRMLEMILCQHRLSGERYSCAEFFEIRQIAGESRLSEERLIERIGRRDGPQQMA